MSSDIVLEASKLERHFHVGHETIKVLAGLDLSLARRQRTAIMGASGCGKTTLLHLVAGMDTPSGGSVHLVGENISQLAEPALTQLRARRIGLIFQDFNLIDSLTAAENIRLPLWLNRQREEPEHFTSLIETLGISALLDRMPNALSGGEKQRIAIARALIHQPDLILADEPTGSLDEATAERVLALFDQVIAHSQAALLMVTHNREAASLCDQQLALRNGLLQPAA